MTARCAPVTRTMAISDDSPPAFCDSRVGSRFCRFQARSRAWIHSSRPPTSPGPVSRSPTTTTRAPVSGRPSALSVGRRRSRAQASRMPRPAAGSTQACSATTMPSASISSWRVRRRRRRGLGRLPGHNPSSDIRPVEEGLLGGEGDILPWQPCPAPRTRPGSSACKPRRTGAAARVRSPPGPAVAAGSVSQQRLTQTVEASASPA